MKGKKLKFQNLMGPSHCQKLTLIADSQKFYRVCKAVYCSIVYNDKKLEAEMFISKV